MIGPVQFQFEVLKRKIWKLQRRICRAVLENKSVAIKGCHGSGKSFVISGMVPYMLMTRQADLVLTIAPTLRQVKLMWNEIDTAIRAIPCKLPDRTTHGWHLDDDRYAIGFSSSKGVNAQGFHAKRVLIIADEAIGISGDLWDAIDGVRMAGDVRIVKLCNPTVPSGPVHEDFTRLRGRPSHECITISAFDTPNLQGLTMESLLQLPDSELDYAPFPMLARRRAVLELYHKWGPTNPRFISRVLGEFPNQADDSVFMLNWIEQAGLPYEPEDLKPHWDAGTFIQVGIDVAGAGSDETVAYARMAGFVLAMEAWSKADPLEDCLNFLQRVRMQHGNRRMIVIGDVVGIGHHFMRGIARAGFEVYGFVANESPIDPVTFRDKKAEAYFQLREYMKAGLVHGIEDEATKAQLSAIRYREQMGRIEIVSKREMKASGVDSPDRAEALIMAFWKFAVRQQTVYMQDEVTVRVSPY